MTSATSPKRSKSIVMLDKVRHGFRGPGRKRFVVLSIDKLKLRRGQGLLVLGPNGAGKTTLLHLISGLLRPDHGRVWVEGRALDTMSEAKLDRMRARTIGYLLQGSALLEGLTAVENVMAPMLFAGTPRRKQRERAMELLDRFDVTHRARHLPPTLSGGERQRVALARALANDPPLLLADEPTSGLDGPSAERLAVELAAIREEGRSLVIVTHHPDYFDEGMDRLTLEPPSRDVLECPTAGNWGLGRLLQMVRRDPRPTQRAEEGRS